VKERESCSKTVLENFLLVFVTRDSAPNSGFVAGVKEVRLELPQDS